MHYKVPGRNHLVRYKTRSVSTRDARIYFSTLRTMIDVVDTVFVLAAFRPRPPCSGSAGPPRGPSAESVASERKPEHAPART